MNLYEEANVTTANHLAAIPSEYRLAARRYLTHKRLTCRPTSIRNLAGFIHRFHDYLGAADPRDVTANTLRRFSHQLVETQAVSTAYYTCMNIKPYISWLRGKRISDAESDALTTRPPDKAPDAKHLIHPPEWDAIVEQCHTFHRRYSAIRHLRSYAALMTLRYAGMRISEMCALDVASVAFDEGGAFLTIPNHAPGLKSGARRVFVIEPAPALKAWLAVHPDARPDSPLFTALRSVKGQQRVNPDNYATHLHLLAERAGVNSGRLKPVTPHDLRHTRATELAKKLGEAHLRNFFGWRPGSAMPSYYVYLSTGDLRDELLAIARSSDMANTKDCPYCAEPIRTAAIKCKHCHSDVATSPRAFSRHLRDER